MRDAVLPRRTGERPRTTPTNPHSQLDQRPDAAFIAELAAGLFALPHVREAPSAISVPGARALWLDPAEVGIILRLIEAAHAFASRAGEK